MVCICRCGRTGFRLLLLVVLVNWWVFFSQVCLFACQSDMLLFLILPLDGRIINGRLRCQLQMWPQLLCTFPLPSLFSILISAEFGVYMKSLSQWDLGRSGTLQPESVPNDRVKEKEQKTFNPRYNHWCSNTLLFTSVFIFSLWNSGLSFISRFSYTYIGIRNWSFLLVELVTFSFIR